MLKEQERAEAAAADSAVAAAFLQGQVRQKVSRFAQLVGSIQETQANKDPYRGRREDGTRQGMNAASRRPSRQAVGGRESREQEWGAQNWRGDSPLPLDVVRVSRSTPLVEREGQQEVEWNDGGPEPEPTTSATVWEVPGEVPVSDIEIIQPAQGMKDDAYIDW